MAPINACLGGLGGRPEISSRHHVGGLPIHYNRDGRYRRRVQRSSQAIVLGIALLIAAVAQVSCGADARRTTLAAELAAVNTARDLFVKWDKAYQMAILDAAEAQGATKQEVHRRLAEYRKMQAKVLEGFAKVYAAIARAATDDGEASFQAAKRRSNDAIKGVRDLKHGKDPPVTFVCGFDLIPEPPLTCP